MNGHDTRDLHSEYLEGTLSEEMKSLVEHHLAECAECRDDLEGLRKTIALIASSPREPAPPEVLAGVMARIRPLEEGAAARRRPVRLFLVPAMQGLAAVAVLAVAFHFAIQARNTTTPSPMLQARDGSEPSGAESLAFDLTQKGKKPASAPLAGTQAAVAESKTDEPGFEYLASRMDLEEVAQAASFQRARAAQWRQVEVTSNGRFVTSQQAAIAPAYPERSGDEATERDSSDAVPAGAAPNDHGELRLQPSPTPAVDERESLVNRATAFDQIRRIEIALQEGSADRRVAELVGQYAQAALLRAARPDGIERAEMKENERVPGADDDRSPAEGEDQARKAEKDAADRGISQEEATLRMQLLCYQRIELRPGDKQKPDGQQIYALPETLLGKESLARVITDAEGRKVIVAELGRKEYEALNKRLDRIGSYTVLADKVRFRFTPIDITPAAPRPAAQQETARTKPAEQREIDEVGRLKALEAGERRTAAEEEKIVVELVLDTAVPPAAVPAPAATGTESGEPAK